MFNSLRSFISFSILCLIYNSRVCRSLSTSPLSRTDGLQQRLRQLASEGGMILLDGDNVRGKTKFKLSKEELCSNVEAWMESECLYGQVTLIYDHASQHSAYFLPKSGLSVVFSGPGRTADDVISRDSSWIMRKLESDVIVVTEDNGLKKRCRTEIKGSASARGNKKKTKSPKVIKQITTPAQKALLDAMAKEQKEREDLKNGVIATVKGENEGENEVVGERSLLDGVEKDGKIEKEEKKLTFVSSLTFADMILEYFHTEKKQPEGESNLAGLTGSTVSSIQPPPFSPLFSSPSSPSPSSTSLDVKGSKYGVELALLRREVELRKQLSGYESSLLTCNRQAAVKIRTRIKNLKSILAECVADGISARKIYSEENFLNVQENEVEKVVEKNTKKIIENGDISDSKEDVVEVDVEVDMSIVDRGSELLENILSNGRPVGTVEETWERIILAEKMRFRLDSLCGGRETMTGVGGRETMTGVGGRETMTGVGGRETMTGVGNGGENKSRNGGNDSEKEEKVSAIVTGIESGSSDSKSSNNAENCTSKKYVTYVNQNFNSVKRLAAVVKA